MAAYASQTKPNSIVIYIHIRIPIIPYVDDEIRRGAGVGHVISTRMRIHARLHRRITFDVYIIEVFAAVRGYLCPPSRLPKRS